MSCGQVREFLDAYIDKELDVVASLEYERHLSQCERCRALYTQYEDLRSTVRKKLPYFEAPNRLEDGIRAQLAPAERAQNRPIGNRPFAGWPAGVLAAAVVILLFGVTLFQLARRRSASDLLADDVVSNHIRSLMANHLADVPSSDQHTVKPWFNGKIDFAPDVRDLVAEGFPLAGGRLDYLENRSVVALVYKRRQHPINLFIWPSPASDSAPRSIAIRGYNVVHWTHSHMNYWAVSDLNAAELKRFALDFEK